MGAYKPVSVTFTDKRKKSPDQPLELHVYVNETEVIIFGQDKRDLLMSLDSEGLHVYGDCGESNGLPLVTKAKLPGYVKVIHE